MKYFFFQTTVTAANNNTNIPYDSYLATDEIDIGTSRNTVCFRLQF